MADRDQTLQRYDLLERIAVGGMAEVFRAKAYGAHGFEKILAIKRILPDLAREPEFENRFIAEAKLAVGLAHANIVQIFDFGRFAGSLYIAMELVDGPDLGRFVRVASERGETISTGASLHIAMELCKGLDVAHGRHVVHSDISPSNILLSRAGEVKVTDFGIARAAAEALPSPDVSGVEPAQQRVMGKWHYMSPEQTRGDSLDARSDLFSAAVVMYELFTGVKLFQAADIKEIVRNVREMPIPPPSSLRPTLPMALDAVLGRALARDPARRYQHAADLLRALLDISYSHTLVATGMDVAEAVRRLFPPEAPAAPSAPLLADDLIRAELDRVSAVSRVTIPATGPPSMITASVPAGRLTFVRGAAGPDGIPAWELTVGAGGNASQPGPRSATASASASASGRSTARWLVSAALGAVAVAAIGAWGFTRAARNQRGDLRIESTDRPHRLELRLDGYQAWSDPAAMIKTGERLIYRPQLQPLTTPPVDQKVVPPQRWGTIDLHVDPWAIIYLDGRKIGEAPVKGLRLPVGRHRLKLVNPVKHRQLTLTVEVPAKRPYRVRLP